MLKDEFKKRYTTIPFAIHRACYAEGTHEVITHYHREIELIAITDGAADFYIDSKCYRAEKGDVLIIPPYALHRVCTPGDTVTSYDCICFDLKLLCDENLKNGLESQSLSVMPHIRTDSAFCGGLREHIRTAMAACESGGEGWELEAVGSISLTFSLLKKNQAVSQKFEASKESDFVRKVMTYIQQNLSSPITSRDVAAELYMTHSYFCRLFKKTFGCPFANYVLTYKLEKARICLISSTLSVTDIAFCHGFNNCSYFGKTFKERFHASPHAYRKKHGASTK